MEKIRKILVNLIRDKKKLRIFLGVESVIFIVLVSILTLTIINKNKSIETAEIANVEIEQNETVEIIEEEEEIEEEPAQELTEEEQKEAEKKENIEKKEDNQKQKNSNTAPSGYNTSYYIKVNYGANVVTIYSKDSAGNYTPVKAMICSTGSATPRSGVYSIKSSKHRWGALFGGVWGQYTTQIVGNILFHSVPYLSANPSNLEYWEYDKLGTTASAGCIRLKVSDAKWIYDCIPVGTPVEFYSDSNPGPLGKPGAQKISGNEQCRGWDPTDPDGNNPWKNVAQQQQSQPEPQPAPVPKPAPTPAPQPQNNTQTNTEKSEENKDKEKQEEPKQNDTNQTENNPNTTTENNGQEENKTDDNNENNGSNNDDTDKNNPQGNDENNKEI